MKYSNHRRTFCNRPHRISTLSPATSTVVSSGNDPTIENKHSPINKDYHDCIQYRSFTDFPYQNLCKNATTFAHRKWVSKGKVSVFHQCLAELPQCHMARDLYKHHSSHWEKNVQLFDTWHQVSMNCIMNLELRSTTESWGRKVIKAFPPPTAAPN